MPLKLMYITNKPAVARIAENAGVDRIFVDMEYIGKSERQGGMDTVQSRHTLDDVAAIRAVISKSELMVRCNPIHEASDEYPDSEAEIEGIIACGADVIMLPYFKTVEEVRRFVQLVDGRAITLPLVETPEAVAVIDELLELDGIDEIFVGLNDLSLGYGMKFMFELLANGTVEMLCDKFRTKGIPYGFGGIASLGKGLLPSEKVIAEHYRLGSTCTILSRSFCNVNQIPDLAAIGDIFMTGVKAIREYEIFCSEQNADFFRDNMEEVKICVARV